MKALQIHVEASKYFPASKYARESLEYISAVSGLSKPKLNS